MFTLCVEPAEFDNAMLGRQNAMSFTAVRRTVFQCVHFLSQPPPRLRLVVRQVTKKHPNDC
jgi:hypothetical protein